MSAYTYEGVLFESEVDALNEKFDFSEEQINDLSMSKITKVILSALPAAAVWIL